MAYIAQSERKSLLAPVLFMLVVGTILISLGVWQLHRLAWKETLIAEIATRSKAPPQPPPGPSEWNRLAPADYAYRHVEFAGRYENDKEALVFYGAGPHDLGPGYLILTPLRLDSGAIVIVNRGFVPVELAAKSARAAGEIEGEAHVTGLMRPPQPRNLFTPADEPDKGIYFTRDPAAIAAHFGLTQTAPFVVDADDTPVPGGWPKGGMTEIDIPNNHLDYALTWFGLAVGLFAVFVGYLRARWHGE
ncbi:MAG TPA: SURF1 family protein [Methylovirgula sp.]|nr:SURF1 family protein [Methylovirgula sp.]